ncbi:chemotaxis protein CheW [Sphingomonas phyllosphaerae]|uniref:chemotaxis protein CheW n=1 Tax=Sphingomonas phyllosphaerae TaxID=257003 RepID=UPI0032216E1F
MSAVGELQVVVFALGDEQFALPVGEVREILDHHAPFRVPNAPAWLLGRTDVRGASVPVIDLRLRLGLTSVTVTPMTRVLVVEVQLAERAAVMTLGLTVDRVLDVRSYAAAAMEPPSWACAGTPNICAGCCAATVASPSCSISPASSRATPMPSC